MSFENLILPDGVLCNASARSKKHCLEILSELLVRGIPDIASETIFACLVGRERLGCTGLDDGAAFPHCRIEGIESPSAALIKLSEPIDFDAPDDQPVDLVFGMLLPDDIDDTHLAEIRRVLEVFSDEDFRSRLRRMNSSADLYTALLDGERLLPVDMAQAAQGG